MTKKIRIKILPWLVLTVGVAFGLTNVTLAEKKTEAKGQDTVLSTYKCTKGSCAGKSALGCCPGDQSRMQKALEKIKGVTNVTFDKETNQVTIEYQKEKLDAKAFTKATNKYGLVK